MVYELAGEALLANPDRECGHPYLQEAGECELCDIDWLLETGNAEEPDELVGMRPEVVGIVPKKART